MNKYKQDARFIDHGFARMLYGDLDDDEVGEPDAIWMAGEIDYKRSVISAMRSIIADLYADRGEDQRVAELCEKALAIADRGMIE